MRYEKGQKTTTRRQILETASRCFRRNGMTAAGIAGIMGDAGLTNGAFYTHFESKEELVREAMIDALKNQQLRLGDDLCAGLDLESVIRSYLSHDHLKAPESGCPSAALLPEIARQPEPTRKAYEQELNSYVSLLANLLGDADPISAHRRATAIFALMVGTLEFARAVSDAAHAEKILEGGIDAALILADAQFASRPKKGAALPHQGRSR
jgi:TetR/AcrR family transcriptional regulator, transcriptional repressor for nem operon